MVQVAGRTAVAIVTRDTNTAASAATMPQATYPQRRRPERRAANASIPAESPNGRNRTRTLQASTISNSVFDGGRSTASSAVDVLTNLFVTRGVPRHIRSDTGPEFIATAIRRHGERAGLEMLYVEPGSPWQNGFAESFFSRLRGMSC